MFNMGFLGNRPYCYLEHWRISIPSPCARVGPPVTWKRSAALVGNTYYFRSCHIDGVFMVLI